MEEFLTPESILSQLNLQKSMVAADFGCGSGGWTLPLAKMIPEGKVYAIDLIKGPLSALESTAKLQGVMNIQTMAANLEEGTKLISNSCDVVLTTNLLFQCEDKKAIFEEAKRVLKPGGKILFIDWKKSASFGPRERAVLPEEIIKIAESIGLKVEKPAPYRAGSAGAGEFDAGPYHYGIIFER